MLDSDYEVKAKVKTLLSNKFSIEAVATLISTAGESWVGSSAVGLFSRMQK